MRTLILALAVSLVLAAPAGTAIAGPFEDAEAAYERGDHTTAARLFRPLAEQGNSNAQHILGFLYEKGQGVRQDYAEAAKWYRRAADRGNPVAQASLGFLYEKGQGVPQDYVQAHMWFNIATSRLPDSRKEARQKTSMVRDAIAAKMTSAQIAEAQKLAREWKPK